MANQLQSSAPQYSESFIMHYHSYRAISTTIALSLLNLTNESFNYISISWLSTYE